MEKALGIIFIAGVAILASFLSNHILIGSITISIVLGALSANIFKLPQSFSWGITFAEKTLLAWAIALLGINLDFNVLNELGLKTVFIVIISMIATFVFSSLLTKKLNFEKSFSFLLTAGNAICGSAAIAASKDILKVDKTKVAIAIAIVNLLGTIALFILPFIGILLGFSDTQIGILLGNTLQSVGHAIAAGFSVNETVGQSAMLTKMLRILLLSFVLIYFIYTVSKDSREEKEGFSIKIPLFVYGFLFFSILASLNILPSYIENLIAQASKITLLLAMTAIGMKISFNLIKQSAWSAFVFAFYIFKFQILFSIILIKLL